MFEERWRVSQGSKRRAKTSRAFNTELTPAKEASKDHVLRTFDVCEREQQFVLSTSVDTK